MNCFRVYSLQTRPDKSMINKMESKSKRWAIYHIAYIYTKVTLFSFALLGYIVMSIFNSFMLFI